MNSIKIVIWDLDDTFWKGTLSEGGIEPIPGNVDIVGQLSRRGIINSIASKNDYGEARAALERLGVWEDFVFAEIRWQAKGPLVRRILSKCRLRAANALFLDDNPLNREEVSFYNSGIAARGPELIPALPGHPALQGKPDPSKQRLRQYKLLERRFRESREFAGNTEFLRQSRITVEVLDDLAEHKDRILELIHRGNQLNFTKVRSTAEELEDLLRRRDLENGAVVVRDRYGDYGVAGFYSLNKRENRLLHFLFSCRILHLGVEQWVYARLGHPDLRIQGEVASKLQRAPGPDWIEQFPGSAKAARRAAARRSTTVLLKGGCDLQQMSHYLAFDGLRVDEELTYPGAANEPIHHEDTSLLRAAAENGFSRLAGVIRDLPFCDAAMFRTRVYKPGYDAVVYSVLMDYTRHLYRHRETGIEIPYGDRNLLEAGPNYAAESGLSWLTAEWLCRFGDDFEHLGPISAERFAANLAFLRERIPAPLIFLNGAEVAPSRGGASQQLRRHREMNRVLDDFIAQSGNCYLLDARNVVTGPEMLVDSVRHYRRAVYPQLAKRLIEILSSLKGRNFEQQRWRSAKGAAVHRLQCLKRSIRTQQKTAPPGSTQGRGAAV